MTVERTVPLRGGDPRVSFLPGMCTAGRGVFIHRTAVVEDVGDLGPNCLVWGMAYVMQGARVGAGTMLGQSVHISAGAEVGQRCSIQNGAQVFTGVVLGDDVFLGPHCVFTNVTVPRAHARAVGLEQTIVGHGASIGANATILCGIKIGEYAMVGAGSVVTKNVRPYALVVGNPAREIGFVCRCGVRLKHVSHAPSETKVIRTCEACKQDILFAFNSLYPYDLDTVEPIDAQK
jgi:UDP-2-acetamido-3-amino-2,3-dideoxy-glucuronate N-acetyltransferase